MGKCLLNNIHYPYSSNIIRILNIIKYYYKGGGIMKYSELINSVKFQTIQPEDFIKQLEEYANSFIIKCYINPGISCKDFDTIFRLKTYSANYVKDEALRQLSHKTIMNCFNWDN
jgi:hypothetical protein